MDMSLKTALRCGAELDFLQEEEPRRSEAGSLFLHYLRNSDKTSLVPRSWGSRRMNRDIDLLEGLGFIDGKTHLPDPRLDGYLGEDRIKEEINNLGKPWKRCESWKTHDEALSKWIDKSGFGRMPKSPCGTCTREMKKECDTVRKKISDIREKEQVDWERRAEAYEKEPLVVTEKYLSLGANKTGELQKLALEGKLEYKRKRGWR